MNVNLEEHKKWWAWLQAVHNISSQDRYFISLGINMYCQNLLAHVNQMTELNAEWRELSDRARRLTKIAKEVFGPQ